jgi:hypothetical protein
MAESPGGEISQGYSLLHGTRSPEDIRMRFRLRRLEFP